MKRQILFSGENKVKLINLSSAELAHRVVKVYVQKEREREKNTLKYNLNCKNQVAEDLWSKTLLEIAYLQSDSVNIFSYRYINFGIMISAKMIKTT